jgi:Fic family protein
VILGSSIEEGHEALHADAKMIIYEEIEITPETVERVAAFAQQVEDFRKEGPLDRVSLAKLEEHFKSSHVYHSAGIEGNRLTLQETMLVLRDGLDIVGKPVQDSVEVRLLGESFDYLTTLAESDQTIRETDIRSLHKLLIGDDPELSPGEYRNVGVIISGSEHRPPEPLEVPGRMEKLVAWIDANLGKNPVICASVAHHELTAIHPFKDGNGRVSRLLMNLILLKRAFPICNIRREDRPTYFDALAFADVGIYDALVRIVYERSADLFAEYARIRTETKRTAEWAARWGNREAEVLRKREAREMELWQSRIRQVMLEFQNSAELLDEQLAQIEIEFYDYKSETITFDKYQELLENGQTERANAFSVTLSRPHTPSEHRVRLMFRYFRNFNKFPRHQRIIPLELNYFDPSESRYVRLSDLDWSDRIRIRELYFNLEGEFVIRYFNRDVNHEVEKKNASISEAVQWFFDDVLQNMFHLR